MRIQRSPDPAVAPPQHTTNRRRRPTTSERAAALREHMVTPLARRDRPRHAMTRRCEGDPYATWDAAYVLGSLSADDERDYEAHLRRCRRCRDVVDDLRVIPAWLALLGRIEACGPVANSPGAAGPRERRRCRRPTLWTRR